MLVQNYVSESKKDEVKRADGKIKLMHTQGELDITQDDGRDTPKLGKGRLSIKNKGAKVSNNCMALLLVLLFCHILFLTLGLTV